MNVELFDVTSLRQTAEAAAQDAGVLANGRWQLPRQLTRKGFRDIVTEVDVAAQKLITDRIRQAYPDHGFLAEENDAELPSDGPVVWIIDPVDGTTNYSRHIPIICVSVAAVEGGRGDGRVLAGAIYDPVRGDIFSVGLGQGCTLNGKPAQASRVTDLSESIIGMDWSRSIHLRQEGFDALGRFAHEVQTIRSFGSASLALAWVAAGRLDGYLNLQLSAWDVAAAQLMIREAGGELTDLQGRGWRWDHEGENCVAGNRAIHAALLRLLPDGG